MENLVHYSNPAHAISLLSVLNEQRLKGQLCDIVLVVGDQRYQAHRSVLAASSEYFQSLFARRGDSSTGPDSHRTVERTAAVVQLDFCEPDAFELVLNYIYSSSLFVDKGSLAAIQELGYSLGIPFLTNIMAMRPQVSYCISRKRVCFKEEEDGGYPQRSVIVRQSSRGDAPGGGHTQSHSTHTLRSAKHNPYSASEEEAYALSAKEQNLSTSRLSRGGTIERGGDLPDRHHPGRMFDVQDDKPNSSSFAPSAMSKGRPGLMMTSTSVRPQLTSSVSFSESQIQHASLQPDSSVDPLGEEQSSPLRSSPKSTTPGQSAAERHQPVDRSGPLIKSLLRRSLSMDSPVPIFSPALELKDSQNREHSVVKMAAKTTSMHMVAPPGGDQKQQGSHDVPPLILRPRHHNLYERGGGGGGDGGQGGGGEVVHVKAEPSSPLADPSDIIRITVGDNLPVNLRDLQMNFNENPKGYFNHGGKRRTRVDSHSSISPYKRSRMVGGGEHTHFTSHKDTGSGNAQSTTSNIAEDGGGGGGEEPGELRPNKMFKCWNCLKIFRSNAGLYRHVNMYHNPEKPYACDICHKRFHTNFKVWTHCQTQHGVVQNPATSSSSYSVLDEKFQRKLIDIVREREIKKALIMKLRRNKQNLQQGQPFAKKSLRSRSTYVCPYCGKMFWFQSQFKQHLKMHPVENDDLQMDRVVGGGAGGDLGGDRDRDRQNQTTHHHLKENQSKDLGVGVYPCKLCNAKLSSPMEQGDHERGCRHATVCPYCGLRFSSASVKRDHEAHCDYKKLTCLECMRTFKSSFSIWRHQVEVHNHNMMTVREQLTLSLQENHSQVAASQGPPPDSSLHHQGSPHPHHPLSPSHHHQHHYHHHHRSSESLDGRKDGYYRGTLSPAPMFDSEDSSYAPEDLSVGSHEHGELHVKEEPMEEAVCERENAAVGNASSASAAAAAAAAAADEPGVWPCEKCGKLFSSHKDLERHQELLCHIKPFICHICHKAFRTNFRLWSHFQSHVSTSDEPPPTAAARELERRSSSSPSSPPPLSISVSPPNTVGVATSSSVTAAAASTLSEEEPTGGPVAMATKMGSGSGSEPEVGGDEGGGPSLSKPDEAAEASLSPQESDTLFYHAPPLSALTFKRQYMCKLCHRTFKTAFSLWSHEQSHNRL